MEFQYSSGTVLQYMYIIRVLRIYSIYVQYIHVDCIYEQYAYSIYIRLVYSVRIFSTSTVNFRGTRTVWHTLHIYSIR